MSETEQVQRNVSTSNPNKRTRRGKKGKYCFKNMLRVIGVNPDGISSKFPSLDYIIKVLGPGIICLQETKVRKIGKLNSENSKKYTIFELVRKHSHGGGLAIMAKPELEPVWIAEGDDQVEVLVVEVRIKELKIRIINAYGPQESDSLERKTMFWSRLQSEVNDAAEAGSAVIIEMDGNLHCGENIISGDPSKINANGKLFSAFLKENSDLFLLNSSEKCEGLITRRRQKDNKLEEAILDYALISSELKPFFRKMEIDEDRKYALTSFLNGKMKKSDHFTLIIDFSINIKKKRPVREEHYNFKCSEGQAKFMEILNTEETLQNCFQNGNNVEDQCEKWFTELNNIFKRSFKKIRYTNKVRETETSLLFKQRAELIQKLKKDPTNESIAAELEDVVAKLTEAVGKENFEHIFNNFKHLDQTSGENFSQGIWSIKKKEFPKKSSSIPAAKVDVNGGLVTDPAELQQLYLDTFTHRLRERPPREEYTELYNMQKRLLEKRMMITKTEKTERWSEDDILEVLKSLKNGKCRDPLGMVNELFKPPVAGADLVRSLCDMMNIIKDKCYVPELLRYKNISAIYKNKGSKSDLNNDRGIFTCTVVNSILQKLLYKDNYDTIDSNLSDSNVGARKRKNIRNHNWIINGIIRDTVNSKSKAVDLAVLDYRQCFDTMSVDITTNDMYEVGVTNDHLNLIYEGDRKSKIAVKTPFGITKRVDLNKVVAQGEINSPLKCSITVDSIASEHVTNLKDHLYHYKDSVPIPPLGMVDDTIGISNCGLDSVLMTAHLNAQTNIKKLQFGEDKCHKLHIGTNTNVCCDNFVDTWLMERKGEDITSIMELVDREGGRHLLETVKSDKYLGDVISSDGKNALNIQERKRRGLVAVNQIGQMLDDLCLGKFHFEAGNILRNSLLLSTLISNSEAWYNLTNKDISELESVDEALLRKILSAHSKTPRELLYLETGNIPIRFIIMARRLNFLWYILNEEEDSLIKRFLEAQLDSPVKGDWVNTVREDLEELKIDLEPRNVTRLSKEVFREIIKESIKDRALHHLKSVQKSHSKARNIKYDKLEMQSYLMSGGSMTIQEKCFAFAARTRMLDLKANFKSSLSDSVCRKCFSEEENQKHLLSCPALRDTSVVTQVDDYESIFGNDRDKISRICRILKSKLVKLKLPSAPPPSAAATLSNLCSGIGK